MALKSGKVRVSRPTTKNFSCWYVVDTDKKPFAKSSIGYISRQLSMPGCSQIGISSLLQKEIADPRVSI